MDTVRAATLAASGSPPIRTTAAQESSQRRLQSHKDLGWLRYQLGGFSEALNSESKLFAVLLVGFDFALYCSL